MYYFSLSKDPKSLPESSQNSQPSYVQTKITEEIFKGSGTNKPSDSPPTDENMFDGDLSDGR